jgi:hypothetical protein
MNTGHIMLRIITVLLKQNNFSKEIQGKSFFMNVDNAIAVFWENLILEIQ